MLSDDELQAIADEDLLTYYISLKVRMAGLPEIPIPAPGGVWTRGNPWGPRSHLRRDCPTCSGTGVANLSIDDAIDLVLTDMHLVALSGDHLEAIRKEWKEVAADMPLTHQGVECPDCRPPRPWWKFW